MKKSKLYTTDEFGRSIEKDSGEYERLKQRSNHRRVSQYERYFEGYEAATVLGRNGRKKVVRVYTGTRFRQQLSKTQRRNNRMIYILLFLLAVSIFILCMILSTGSNSAWYVVLAGLVPAVCYARLLMALNLYVFSGRDLTVHEYKDGARKLVEVTRHIDRIMMLPMIATAVFFVLEPDAYSTVELLRLFLFVLSASFAKAIGKLEGRVEYLQILPDDIDGEETKE